MQLAINNLTCTINHKTVVQNITVSFSAEKITAILGASGAGKTSVLRCIAGLQPYTGSILADDQPLESVPVPQRQFGYVEQHYNLFPHLSAFENIAYPLRIRKQSKTMIRQAVADLAEQFHLEQVLTRRPHELSGGEQQRVAIARAVIYEPRLLLLDEPFSALDALTRVELVRWCKAIVQERRMTVLYVTHDIAEARFISDAAVIMEHGLISAQGQWSELHHPLLDSHF